MSPHPRLRRFTKWASLLASVTLLLLWIWTLRYGVVFITSGGGFLNLHSGCFGVGHITNQTQSLLSLPTVELTPTGNTNWRLSFDRGIDGYWHLTIPIWCLLFLTLPAARLTWQFDTLAKRHANLCPKCNYDRRGIDPLALCPECNTAPKPDPLPALSYITLLKSHSKFLKLAKWLGLSIYILWITCAWYAIAREGRASKADSIINSMSESTLYVLMAMTAIACWLDRKPGPPRT